MKYGLCKDGVELLRDCYGEHFDSEVKFNYIVKIYGEPLEESNSEGVDVMARRLKRMAKRLDMIANFLAKRKRTKRSGVRKGKL